MTSRGCGYLRSRLLRSGGDRSQGFDTMKQLNLFVESGAEFSKYRDYRYSLWRFWEKDKGYAAFVCLNPSTADEYKNDPTVTRCINYARAWGYGGMIMLNLFAYRSTHPKNLYIIGDPIGPDNDLHLRSASSKAMVTIAAWGIHGKYLNRDKAVMKILTNPKCLAITKDGFPGHPLYLKGNLKPKDLIR